MLLLWCYVLEFYPSSILPSGGSLQYHGSNSYCLQQGQALTLRVFYPAPEGGGLACRTDLV